MPSINQLVHRTLIAWVGAGVARILIGSSTSPIAYLFFGLFWLISVLLLAAAIWQLFVAEAVEQKVEAGAICTGVVSLLAQGLLGNGDTSVVAAFMFWVSAIVLLCVYGRRLRRGYALHS